MKTKTKTLLLIPMIIAVFKVNAESVDRQAFHAAMESCFTETGVTKPAEGTRPSKEDRQKIKACLAAKGMSRPEGMRRGFGKSPEARAAFIACANENGIKKPEPGTKPSDEDRAKLRSCMEEKGFGQKT